MDILGILIWLIVFCAVAGVVWWFLQHAGLPQPVVIIVYAVLAIIALILLFQLVGGMRAPRLR